MQEIEVISDFQEEPIPKFKPSTNWKEVPINDNGEKLVALNNLNPDLIRINPQYFNQNIPHALATMYVREGAASALLKAAQFLPKDLKLVIWDAWRPLDVQRALFDSFKRSLHIKYPDWDEKKLLKETQTYVSLPSDDPGKPSPHFTGGSVDLSICDKWNAELPMGVPFDFFGKEASTDFYERPDITPAEILFRNNRRLLFHILMKVGFTNYNEEAWHYDLGNQFDAARRQTVAVYGVPDTVLVAQY